MRGNNFRVIEDRGLTEALTAMAVEATVSAVAFSFAADVRDERCDEVRADLGERLAQKKALPR